MILENKPWETMGDFCCDPMTAITVASTAFKVFGAIKQGTAESALADRNAEIAKVQTDQRLETQDRERRLRRGSNMAAAGASGVGIESFGDILSSSAAQEEMDMMNIKSEGLLQQQSYEIQSDQATSGMWMGVGSSLLGGASSLYGGQKGTKSYGKVGSQGASKTHFPKTNTTVKWNT